MNAQASVESIFAGALEIDSAEDRVAYLDAICGNDRQVRARVEQLLQGHAKAERFLESVMPGVSTTPPDPGPHVVIGSRIGPYRLLQQIGEGGMGAVFMAEQEQPVRRKVALKVIKPGMDSGQVVARFEAERQALAIMDHVNIARVLDAGATESGRPYFVMELVHGIPITRYCDDNHLTPRQRLELFVPVCQAIQHAHQKGIIHRDIKPSNVLVTLYDGQPAPKVIDFGLAKATERVLTERTLFTNYGVVVGTLEYMSPEQAETSALGVDTRTDIYSLGVLLYELLTGTTPVGRNRLKEAGYAEVLRLIKEEEPPRPSTRLGSSETLPAIAAARGTEPVKLTRLVKGDLDWIVMKCLEKDRTRRYETADAVARDVQRYLADEAVEACPPSAWYRFRKFARRNKVPLAMAAVILIATLALAGGVGWTMLKEASQRAKIINEAQAALAEEGRWHARSRWPEARAALNRARAVLESAGGDEHLYQHVLKLEKDLDTVERLETIRSKRITLPKPSLKVDYAPTDQAYTAAFREFGVDVDELEPAEAAARIRASSIAVELAATLDDWSWVRRAQLKMPKERWQALVQVAALVDSDDWRNRAREAATTHNWQALRELARSADFKTLPPKTLHLLAVNLAESPDDSDFEAAKRFLRRAHWHYPDDFWINHELGIRWQWPGNVPYAEAALSLRGQNINLLYLVAFAYLEQKSFDTAIEAFETILTLEPTNFERAMVHQAMGSTWGEKGNLDRALAEYTTALRYESSPEIKAGCHYSTASILMDRNLDESIAEFQKALKLKPDYARAYCNLGLAYRMNKEPDKALKAFQDAVRHDPNMFEAHSNLGVELMNRNDLAGAVLPLDIALRLRPSHPDAHLNWGNLRNRQGHRDDAIAAYRKTIQLRPDVAMAHYNLGLTLRDNGERDGAIAAFQEAVRLKPDYKGAWVNLAEQLQYRRSFEKSLAAYERAIALAPRDAVLRFNRGNCLSEKGDRAAAIKAYQEAIDVDPKYAGAWSNLGCRLFELGRFREAIEPLKQAVAIDPKMANAHNNLGTALEMDGRLDEAIVAYREATRLDKGYANARGNLGYALSRGGDLEGGRAELEEAIRLQPLRASHHLRLGGILVSLGDWGRAEAALRRAVALDPLDAEAHCELGQLLQHQGQFTQGLASIQLGHQLGSRTTGWPHPSEKWLRVAERLVEINSLLPAALAGKFQPVSAGQRLDFAWVCSAKNRHTAAASFYQQAFTERPKFENDLKAGFRYSAACRAAQAGSDADADVNARTEETRALWRKQAVAWLSAELEAWKQQLETGSPRVVAGVLRGWQRDRELASVRDNLASLPQAEREACRKLWADVQALRLRATPNESSPK